MLRRRLMLAVAALAALSAFAAAPAAAALAPSPGHYSALGPPHAMRAARPPIAFHTHPLTSLGSVTSGNWSGYVAFGNHFRFAEADYTVPSLNCSVSPDPSFSSQWVGLDGFGTSTVEQAGTFGECSGGSPSYFAFWEMFPNASNTFSVSPGDAIHVTIYYNGHWNLTVLDRTTNSVIRVSEACPSGSVCHNGSAEVISETPNGGPPAALLADYGQVGFTHVGLTSSAGQRGNFVSSLWHYDTITEVSPTTNATMQSPGTLEGPGSGVYGGYGNQAFTDAALNSGG